MMDHSLRNRGDRFSRSPGNGDRPRANAALVEDRAKLLIHRLVARRIRRNPCLVTKVATAMDRLARDPRRMEVMQEWRPILELPVGDLQRRLTERSHTMDRLRIESPFGFVPDLVIDDYHLRRRIWALARKGLELRLAASARSRS